MSVSGEAIATALAVILNIVGWTWITLRMTDMRRERDIAKSDYAQLVKAAKYARDILVIARAYLPGPDVPKYLEAAEDELRFALAFIDERKEA